jgi:hypothetical protein
MKMVRHHHERIGTHTGIMRRDFVPYIPHHPPGLGQRHPAIHQRAEQRPAILHADRHKIPTRLRVIVSTQPDRPAMMYGWIVGHLYNRPTQSR